MIAEAIKNMDKSKKIFGKEVYQKRFKPVYEGYITALCSVLEHDDETTTEKIKGQ